VLGVFVLSVNISELILLDRNSCEVDIMKKGLNAILYAFLSIMSFTIILALENKLMVMIIAMFCFGTSALGFILSED